VSVTSLSSLLGLQSPPANGLAWHGLILEGLPYEGVVNLAHVLEVKEADVANWLGLTAAARKQRKTAKRLSAVESDQLYRLARAWRALMVPLSDEKETALWLRTARPELRDAIPMTLLETTLGTEFVMTAIGRVATVDRIIVHKDAPDYEDGLAAENGRNPHEDCIVEDGEGADEEDEVELEDVDELHEDRMLEEALLRNGER
jgi:putative toxin-antitoxin system antitoxin component (TIGR02293 family)